MKKKSFFNKKKIGTTIKNGIVTGIVSVLSTAHLSFQYGLDYTEDIEASLKKRAYGEIKDDVVRARQVASLTTILQRKEDYRMAKRVISDFTDNVRRDIHDILHETDSLKTE